MVNASFRILPALAVMAVVVAAALTCGCLSVLTMTSRESPADMPGLYADMAEQRADWSFSRGCYWTADFTVYNTGDSAEKNVILYVELVNADSGAVRDSRSSYIGSILPGESKRVKVELDGDCLEDYTVRAVPAGGKN